MIEDIIHEVEEGAVYFDLMLASTPRTLLLRLQNNETLHTAKQRLQVTPEEVCAYLARAEQIYAQPVESGYAHPLDRALAAYLFLLGRYAEESVQDFVRRVAEEKRLEFRNAVSVAKYFVEDIPSLPEPTRQSLPTEASVAQ